MNHRYLRLFAGSICVCLFSSALWADAEPDAPHVLFVRGADRSGGFLEAGNDAARTEQLADINNESTNNGNHGWFEFASLLRSEGYIVEQVTEPLESDAPSTGQTDGAPFPFQSTDLTKYRVIVMGSNNAVYDAVQIDAIDSFVQAGGGVLFISDANFGSDWPDAPNSDQQFLDRFGWTMQQDQGTNVLRRDAGDFVDPANPVLVGVDAFDGEGVSPIVAPISDIVGVRSTIVVRARPGSNTRNNDSTSGQGSSRGVGPQDAALCIGYAGAGRIAGHYDRNTFFNDRGAGTNIGRFDNATYAQNLIRWLAFGEHDRDADFDVDIDDLHIQNQSTVDVNGDGLANSEDIELTMIVTRSRETSDLHNQQTP
ncbi:MAG: DUF4350 domain-containing protein [Phycisphaerales bacterium]